MPLVEVVQELEEEGFSVKISDEGVIAHLNSRKPSYREIVSAVPRLEGLPMETVGDGVFISVGEGRLSV
jgi:hypothetical protein